MPLLQVKASPVGHLCYFIFVAPPSYQELERRLRNRGTETEDKVLQRLANAKAEIAKSKVRATLEADSEIAWHACGQVLSVKWRCVALCRKSQIDGFWRLSSMLTGFVDCYIRHYAGAWVF